MILIFDLDDTLYDEILFVRSGFRQVASFLSIKFNLSENLLFRELLLDFRQNGRGQVFDNVLKKFRVYNKTTVHECLMVYRLHKPDIHLRRDAADCLRRFAHYSKYILTDGNKIVQRNKIEALKLGAIFKKAYLTHCYGKHNAKPSPYCFLKIAEAEQMPHANICYIGDNPYKDFVGIKPLGFKTVRLNQGMFRNIFLDTIHEAHVTINSLSEIPDLPDELFIGK